jgi:uncharacterized membrane protein
MLLISFLITLGVFALIGIGVVLYLNRDIYFPKHNAAHS